MESKTVNDVDRLLLADRPREVQATFVRTLMLSLDLWASRFNWEAGVIPRQDLLTPTREIMILCEEIDRACRRIEKRLG